MNDPKDCGCKGANVQPDGSLKPNDPDSVCPVHGSALLVYCSPVPKEFSYVPAKPGEFDVTRPATMVPTSSARVESPEEIAKVQSEQKPS